MDRSLVKQLLYSSLGRQWEAEQPFGENHEAVLTTQSSIT